MTKMQTIKDAERQHGRALDLCVVGTVEESQISYASSGKSLKFSICHLSFLIFHLLPGCKVHWENRIISNHNDK